ncbi:ImmA/IrrE family metallo-endopeptidase [Halalkalibacter sp. APA_J-10(15)]|uniref:ImmA/IrrE family metallo-endopeptidase n=1 Tax=Halalkalibacter sp. APA_J-10(15) TaxID=2933805 RepID=UPI001FF4BE19|nr:ImmA/IrrE family metallo-endopeptidase [Halalkalibacter sp. APA_J-10(15)]MCK0473786.1 ImmA/IrrE family metallo-endopeptidase [Halalkalibacter sp. APA_J-10(15)]
MKYATLKEIQVTNMMKEKNINTIEELSLENVSEVFKVDILYHERKSNCLYDEDYAVIYLDSRLPYYEQRLMFFHELAHVISHEGSQNKLEKEFIDLQEAQANRLALYLSMPRYLFEPLAMKYQSVEKLHDLFELPQNAIIERMASIKREQERTEFHLKLQTIENQRTRRSLQPGQIYSSTKSILHQLKDQVGEEKLSYDVKRLL